MNCENALPGAVFVYRVDPAEGTITGQDGRRTSFVEWLDALAPATGREKLEHILYTRTGEADIAVDLGREKRHFRARRTGDALEIRDITGEVLTATEGVVRALLQATDAISFDFDVKADVMRTTYGGGEVVHQQFSLGEYGPIVRAARVDKSGCGTMHFEGGRAWYRLIHGDRDRPLRYLGVIIPDRSADGKSLVEFPTVSKPSPTLDLWREERYRLLGELADIVTFDYDPVADVLVYAIPSPLGGRAEVTVGDFMATLGTNPMIAPESRNAVRTAFLRGMNSATSGSFEYRADFHGAGHRWHRARYASVANEQGAVYRVVGRADEIEGEMTERANLMKSALIDSMTGLYNRGTAQKLIEHLLAEARDGRLGALFVIDIDDFKHINDSLGHLGGDAALKMVAESIRGVFREEDVKGRYGGDEFIVYMRAFSDPEVPAFAARRLMDRLSEQSLATCSVGVALVTAVTTFEDAFARADRALYRAKKSNKSCYCMDGEPSMEN